MHVEIANEVLVKLLLLGIWNGRQICFLGFHPSLGIRK